MMKRPERTLCLALALITLALFCRVTQFEFVDFDDNLYVTENPAVQSGLTLDNVRWAFAGSHAAFWHPLTWLSLMLDATLFGMNAGGYHLTALLWHTATTTLLFLTLRRMTGALWPSALVAALFAWHPLHVESVAWVAERKDVLSAFFWVLTTWLYLDYAERRGRCTYLLMLAAFAFGLMAKPMLVTLPCVLLLLDFWPLQRLPLKAPPGSLKCADAWLPFEFAALKPLLWEKIPLFALATGASWLAVAAQKNMGSLASLDQLPVTSRLGNAATSYVIYLGKTIWPSGLAVMHPHTGAPPAMHVALSLVVLISVSVFAVATVRRAPWLAVGWFWYVGTLVPVSGVVQVGPHAYADRYTYVPLIGVFLVLIWAGCAAVERWRPGRLLMIGAAAGALGACAGLTLRQVEHWRDSPALFRHALAVTRDNAVVHFSLGTFYQRRGRWDEAASCFTEALRIVPDFPEAHVGYGLWLAHTGKPAEAKKHCLEALRLKPGLAAAHNNLGLLLADEGKLDEAAAAYGEAVRVQPDFYAAHNNWGLVLARQGKASEAAGHFLTALRFNPGAADTCCNLGIVLALMGKLNEARFCYTETLRLQPGNASAHYNLGMLLVTQKKDLEALPHLEAAVRLDSTDACAVKQLELLRQRLGTPVRKAN